MERYTALRAWALAVVLAVASSGCGQPALADPALMPLLDGAPPRLYISYAFELFEPETMAAIDARYKELTASGMDTARHLFDWPVLEPAPGVYDLSDVVEAMDLREEQGIRFQFANITVIDSEGILVPPDIAGLLEDGLPWDDPRIVGRFTALLDQVTPIMLERGLFMLGLKNEAGGYYEDNPAQAASFKDFIAAAIAHVRTIEPDLTCTATFAGPGDPSIPDLMPLIDAATFNTYIYTLETDSECTLEGFPLPLFRADVARNVGQYLDDLIAVSQGKLINIQEIGQATGWDDMPETLGPNASLENQRAVIEALAQALDERRDRFRTVCVWQLNDNSRAGTAFFTEALLADGLPPCYANNISEIFGPAGLVRSTPDASPKPAFDAFKDAVAYFAQPPAPSADIDGNGSIDAIDIQLVINAALELIIPDVITDLDQSGQTGATDIQTVINAALDIG